MTIWTREACIAAVQAFRERRGYQPVSREATRTNGLPSWPTVVRIFGTWNALIEAAGFDPYPAQSSAEAKTRAFRDRNPDWRRRENIGAAA